MSAPRILAIGGGTGLPQVLDGLCTHAQEKGEDLAGGAVTAVVTVMDDGGSSGRLRRDLGMLPPGDIRNCLSAVMDRSSPFRELIQHRFTNAGELDGHAVGNLLLSALTQITGDFVEAVDRLGSMIGIRGRVLPTTREQVTLRARMSDGDTLSGETHIVGPGKRIQSMWLEPSPQPMPEVLEGMVGAEGIVIGPGSLYTSLLPSLLVERVASTLSEVDAVRIYIANLMTEPGETDDHDLDDHLRVIRQHTGYDLFDYILVNRRALEPTTVARYATAGARPVTVDRPLRWAGTAQVIECDLAPRCCGSKIRHEPRALARAIRALVKAGRPRRCH